MRVTWIVGTRSNMGLTLWDCSTSMWSDLCERVFDGGVKVIQAKKETN